MIKPIFAPAQAPKFLAAFAIVVVVAFATASVSQAQVTAANWTTGSTGTFGGIATFTVTGLMTPTPLTPFCNFSTPDFAGQLITPVNVCDYGESSNWTVTPSTPAAGFYVYMCVWRHIGVPAGSPTYTFSQPPTLLSGGANVTVSGNDVIIAGPGPFGSGVLFFPNVTTLSCTDFGSCCNRQQMTFAAQFFTSTDDVAMEQIVSPTNPLDCLPLSAAESVTVEVRNLGTNAIASGTVIPLSYQIDSNPVVSEFLILTSAMMPADTLQYTFVNLANFSTVNNYTLTATASYLADLVPGNDSLSTPIGSGGQLRVSTFPYVENFDLMGGPLTTTPPLGFINETTDSVGPDSDWSFRSDATPSAGTGPTADHTTGVAGSGGYAYLEGNGSLSPINLRTPCFDLSGVINPNCRFWVHSNSTAGAGANQLSVDVISYPSGTISMNVIPSISHIGSAWTLQAIDLSPFIGQVVQLVLRGNTTTVGSAHDIAIDDFTVADLQPTPGQAPQFGLAVLDLNNPVNANGDALQFGFGGPYFTNVVVGDTLLFKIDGTPLQFITLLGGPLNPAVATFPGVGSVDLGGPIDPLTGIPTAITVIADGPSSAGLGAFFFTAANGHFDFGVTVPAFQPGLQVTFQAIISASAGVGFKLTNAVEVTF